MARKSQIEDTQVESTEVQADVAVEAKSSKSIVPNKYGNKYKNGGSDELATFINSQATVEKTFDFGKFFSLARANGVAEEQVAKYEAQVGSKQHGSQGRARMTIRNMLATIVRKNGALVGLDGETVSIALAPLPVRAKKVVEAVDEAA
jgi:hypothetical protein